MNKGQLIEVMTMNGTVFERMSYEVIFENVVTEIYEKCNDIINHYDMPKTIIVGYEVYVSLIHELDENDHQKLEAKLNKALFMDNVNLVVDPVVSNRITVIGDSNKAFMRGYEESI